MSNIIPDEGEVACYHRNGSVTIVTDKVFARVIFLEKLYEQIGVMPVCVSYEVGAKMYSMSEKFFREWVNEIGAVHKVGRRSLVDLRIVDKYLQYC